MPALAQPQRLVIGAHRWSTPRAHVVHAATLRDGYALALRLLDPHAAPVPTLILLDLHAHEPHFPELAAPQLAAVLAHEMQTGAIHPAWLVGLARGPQWDAEAYLAGCHLALHRPFRSRLRAGLDHLARLPAALPPTDRATVAYQQAAMRVLHAVQAAQIPVWTADDVRRLLGWLTPYPLPAPLRARLGSPETLRVLRALGGPRAARRRLHALVDAWSERQPLDATVLQLFLDGWERKAIVGYFVRRHLYEDSRVYTVITRLPERIAQALRMTAATENT